MTKPDLKVVEGGEPEPLTDDEMAIVNNIHDWMRRRGCQVQAVDALGNQVSFIDPAAIAVKVWSPANQFFYSMKARVSAAAGELGIEVEEDTAVRISDHILAMGRHHKIKGNM